MGVANLYMGYAFAIWDVPRTVAARPSRRAVAVALLTVLSGAGFFIWNQRAQWYPFTLIHAAVLSGAFLSSHLFTKGRYSYGHSRVPWPDYFNAKVEVVMEVCREHGWDLTSEGVIHHLADAGLLHFNEGDYDVLAQRASDLEHEIEELWALPETADGRPDYDLACAVRIVTLADVMAGSGDREGVVARVERDFDLSGFDRQAFQALCWVADGLKRQWGPEALYYRRLRPRDK